MPADIRTYLVLSTAHLDRASREYLDRCAEGCARERARQGAPDLSEPPTQLVTYWLYGWWVFMDTDALEGGDVPPALAGCMRYCIATGPAYIMFDRDMDEDEALPTYDEDTDERIEAGAA